MKIWFIVTFLPIYCLFIGTVPTTVCIALAHIGFVVRVFKLRYHSKAKIISHPMRPVPTLDDVCEFIFSLFSFFAARINPSESGNKTKGKNMKILIFIRKKERIPCHSTVPSTSVFILSSNYTIFQDGLLYISKLWGETIPNFHLVAGSISRIFAVLTRFWREFFHRIHRMNGNNSMKYDDHRNF